MKDANGGSFAHLVTAESRQNAGKSRACIAKSAFWGDFFPDRPLPLPFGSATPEVVDDKSTDDRNGSASNLAVVPRLLQ